MAFLDSSAKSPIPSRGAGEWSLPPLIKIMRLTLAQAKHLRMAAEQGGILDALQRGVQRITIHPLIDMGLLIGSEGKMSRYFAITEKGRRELERFGAKRLDAA